MSNRVFTIAELLSSTVAQDAAQLVTVLGPWLLVGPPPPDSTDDSSEWSFRTGSLRTITDVDDAGQVMMLREDFVVYPLKKRQGTGPFRDTILIGRSSSNDVTIRDGSISKLHARVVFDDDTGAPHLEDAGSSNGTALNGQRLAEGERLALSSGQIISLGTRAYHVLATEALYPMLQRFGG